MKLLLLSQPGIEDVTVEEVKRALGVEVTQGICEVKDVLEACTLCYVLRSVDKVLVVLSIITYKDMQEVMDKVAQLDVAGYKQFIKDTFIVDTENQDKDRIVSRDVAAALAKRVLAELNMQPKYKNATTPLLMYFSQGTCHVCVDLAGMDLNKRDYRIFIGHDNLKGTTAFAMLRLAGYEKDKVLVDPFCKSGTIVIEAALYGINKSPHFHEKTEFAFNRFVDFPENFFKDDVKKEKLSVFALDAHQRNIAAAKKNAKLAGVQKVIQFSRKDLQWLDLKFEKESVDCIVAVPPQPSKWKGDGLPSLYAELFNQAKYVLKPDGKIALLVTHGADVLQEKGKEHGFAVEQRKIMQGKEEHQLLLFKR